MSGRFTAAYRRATTPEICKRFNELVAQGFNPLILMPRTALCDEVNAATNWFENILPVGSRHLRHHCELANYG